MAGATRDPDSSPAAPYSLADGRAAALFAVLARVGIAFTTGRGRVTGSRTRWAVADPVGLVSELTLAGYYPALPWVAYMCVGLMIGQLQLSSRRTGAILFASG